MTTVVATLSPQLNQEQTTQAKNERESKEYSQKDVAVIKGWSGTDTVNECMPVWEKFQRSKSIDGHRNIIKTSMIQWGYDRRTEVDSAVFFEKKLTTSRN